MTNGGWTLIASKYTSVGMQGIPQFNKSWNEFKNGFGDPTTTHWIGLELMHYLTSLKQMQYRIDVSPKDFLVRDWIFVHNLSNKYMLKLGNKINGNLPSYSVADSMLFTTFDYDNDYASINCANNANWVGGWWHSSCYLDCLTCQHLSNSYRPGNIYNGSSGSVENWLYFDNFEMKIK